MDMYCAQGSFTPGFFRSSWLFQTVPNVSEWWGSLCAWDLLVEQNSLWSSDSLSSGLGFTLICQTAHRPVAVFPNHAHSLILTQVDSRWGANTSQSGEMEALRWCCWVLLLKKAKTKKLNYTCTHTYKPVGLGVCVCDALTSDTVSSTAAVDGIVLPCKHYQIRSGAQ